MIPAWIAALAALAVILVNIVTAAVTYGSLQSQTKNNTEAIKDLKTDVSDGRAKQWEVLNAHTEDISYMKGRQGLNGHANGASAGGHD
jgi:hypothetical protein